MHRNISLATPQTSNIPSKIFRWFTCTDVVPDPFNIASANLDNKLANVDSGENFINNLDAFCIRNHSIIFPSDVEVTLIELP